MALLQKKPPNIKCYMEMEYSRHKLMYVHILCFPYFDMCLSLYK